MNTKYWFISFTIFLGFLGMGAGGSSKASRFILSFHMEGGEDAANPDLITPVKLGSEHKQYFFIKIPIFTERDISWYYPFISQDGNSWGAAFKLKEDRSPLLKKISEEHQGKLFGTRVIDAPLRAVLIDQPITDGIVVIWDGLAKSHLQVIDTRIKHIDSFTNSNQTPSLPSFNNTELSGGDTQKRPKFNLFNKKKTPKVDSKTNPNDKPQ